MTFRFKKAQSDVSDSTDRMGSELRALVAASEALLRKTAAHTGEGVDEARHALQHHLNHAQGIAGQWRDTASRKYHQISSASDEFVHDNPWKAIGIAAAVGMVVSLLAAVGTRGRR